MICKRAAHGSPVAGIAVRRRPLAMAFRAVPAEVCGNGREEYLAGDVTTALLDDVEARGRNPGRSPGAAAGPGEPTT